MVEDEPALVDADRRGPAADLEDLPGAFRHRDEAVLPEPRQRGEVVLDGRGRGVADPDAGPRIVQPDGQRLGLARDEQGEVPHRPVEERVRRLAGGVGDRLGEQQGVLVRVQAEIGPEPGLVAEGRRPEPLPALEVRRCRDADPRAQRPVGGVRHDPAPEPRDVGDPRVLDPAAARVELPRLLRLEGHPEALDADGRAVAVEHDERPTDARVVALGDEPREEERVLPVAAPTPG